MAEGEDAQVFRPARKKARGKKKGSGKDKFIKGFKKLVSQYKSKAIFMVVDFVEREAINLIGWFKDMIKIKQMIRKFVISAVLSIAAVIVIVLGIANYIAELASVSAGLMQIVVGVVLLIVAMIYKKS